MIPKTPLDNMNLETPLGNRLMNMIPKTPPNNRNFKTPPDIMNNRIPKTPKNNRNFKSPLGNPLMNRFPKTSPDNIHGIQVMKRDSRDMAQDVITERDRQ